MIHYALNKTKPTKVLKVTFIVSCMAHHAILRNTCNTSYGRYFRSWSIAGFTQCNDELHRCVDDIGATAVAPWLGENWVFPSSQLMHLNVKSPVRAINVDGVRKIGINEANIEHIKG